ncbi:MAG: hypothetical protein JEZ00_10375 [Anaerolineaceae bacterium]|nr:hypothetical protein [Anaerolineaceae bacterium]
MQRIYATEHKGKRILIQDFSNVKSTAEFMELLDETEKMLTSEPKDSVLSIFDATNMRYSSESLSRLKGVVQRSDPHMKATSIIGIKGMMVVALKSASRLVDRQYYLAKTHEEAMDWLIEQ